MKKKFRSYYYTDKLDNGSIVFIYGELWEDGLIDAINIFPCKCSRDGKSLQYFEGYDFSKTVLLQEPYTRTKYFNMGWAICCAEDKFDRETGIEICRRRFRKYPLTSHSGTFLTTDMVKALLKNEADYIKAHQDKFIKSPSKEYKTELNEEPDSVIQTSNKEHLDEEQRTEESFVGKFVILKSDPDRIFIGRVHHTEEEKIYFNFIFGYGGTNGYHFNELYYNEGGRKYICLSTECVDHIATSLEVKEALGKLSESKGLRWSYDENRLIPIEKNRRTHPLKKRKK